MRSVILLSVLALAGCEMTPTQQRWTAIGVGMVATGLILSHESNEGRGPLTVEAAGKGRGTKPWECTGETWECK